jgi:hypothetical protein
MWIEMGSIDAARSSCGSNPGMVVAIQDLFLELSPLFHADSLSRFFHSLSHCFRDEAAVFSRVNLVSLASTGINRCGSFLVRFECWWSRGRSGHHSTPPVIHQCLQGAGCNPPLYSPTNFPLFKVWMMLFSTFWTLQRR